MDRRSWRATVHGVKKSQTGLSDQTTITIVGGLPGSVNHSREDWTLGGIYGNLWFIASWWQPWLAKGSEVRAVFWDWALNLWTLCKVQIDSFWIELDWCQRIEGLLSVGKTYPRLVGLPSQRCWGSSVSRQNTEEFSLYVSLYNNGKFCLARVFRDL